MKRLYQWAVNHVHSPYAPYTFAGLVFIEAFFFMPVGTLLLVYCTQKPEKSFFYALLATAASVAGALVAYILGAALWDTVGQQLVNLFVSPATFTWLTNFYQTHHISAVLLVSFLPIPYKLITLTAGFCKLPLGSFLVCTFIARFARFFTLALALHFWGSRIREIIDHYFYYLVAFCLGALIISSWLMH
jgi:membrane protein YqaA with SNARE-associated domain